MLAIFKRDFKSYMNTVIGPVFIFFMVILFAIYFINTTLIAGSNNLNSAVFYTAYIGFFILMPILGMKSFSDERRHKTDQLIMTAPISVFDIVFGKFLALAAVFAIPTAVICIMPLALTPFGDIPYLWNYTDILGFFLYGLMAISICMFFSSLTDNVIVSVVLSAFALIVGAFSHFIYQAIQNTKVQGVVKGAIGFLNYLENMMLGTLSLKSVIYFISVTALFLFLCTQVIQKRRFTVSKNTVSVSSYSVVTVVIGIVIAVAVNVVATQIPEKIAEIDVTPGNYYSIGQETKNIVKKVNDDITIYFLARETDDEKTTTKDEDLDRILKEYESLSDKITLVYVDPIVNTKFSTKYTEDKLGYSSVIVVDNTTGRSKAINWSDMYDYSYDSSYNQTLSAINIESELDNAIQYVALADDQLLKGYVVTGHEEASFDSAFTEIYGKYNITMSDLALLNTGAVPDDCSLLVINAPYTDYTEDEVNAILAYFAKGGNAIISTGFVEFERNLPNFDKILAYYGVTASDGVIVEQSAENLIAQASYNTYFFANLGSSVVADGITSIGQKVVIVGNAVPFSYDAESTEVSYSEILSSSDQSYVATTDADVFAKGSSCETGSKAVGLECAKTVNGVTSKAVIYASYQIFVGDYDTMTGGTQVKLFANTISSLVSFNGDFVVVPSKSVNNSIIVPAANIRMFAMVLVISALAVLVGGIVVYFARRRK